MFIFSKKNTPQKRIGVYFVLAISLFMSSCFESSPPKDFEAVVPVEQDPTRSECPNLIGTYLLSSAQEQNIILEKPIDNKGLSYFSIDSLVASQAYNYALRMNRDYFISYAQDLKKSEPEKYHYWRENILLINKAYSEVHLSNVLKYGATFERRGQLHVHGCSNGWVKIQQTEKSIWDVKSSETYIKQDDVWLARDKYGDLLIHTISYRQKSGWTFWAAGGAGMKLIPIVDQWNKIRKAPDTNLNVPWNETDLPLSERPNRNINQCQLPAHELIDFNQRLLQRGENVD
jgi:hypothetical protein